MKRFWMLPLFLTITLLLTSCGAPKYTSGSLDVTVKNISQSSVANVQVIHDGVMSNAGTLAPGDKLEAAFLIEEDAEIQLNYDDRQAGDVSRTIRVPARPKDGGAMDILIDDNGLVEPVSRFDLY